MNTEATNAKITVAIDDGSGNIAFAYNAADGSVKSGIRKSIIQKGGAFSAVGAASGHTWMDANGDGYTAEETENPIDTCSIDYQTSIANRALVLDTLTNYANLAGKTVDIGVTLPAGVFFLPDGRNTPNAELIERKKANLKTAMTNRAGLNAPIIDSVTVFPEAIPAFFYAATDEYGEARPEFKDVSRAIVADVGQFTCDLALLEIKQSANDVRNMSITKLKTTEHGVHCLHNSLREKLSNRQMPQTVGADTMTRATIEQLISRGFLGSAFNSEHAMANRVDIREDIQAATMELNQLIRKDLKELHSAMTNIDVIILVGGGAHLLKDVVNSDRNDVNWGQYVYTPKNPEMAVVLGIHQLMERK